MDLVKSLFIIFSLLGVESKFGVGIGKAEWLDDEKLWSLTGVDGQNLGQFKGLVAADKNIVSPRTVEVTGRSPPLGMTVMTFFPWLSFYLSMFKQFMIHLSFVGATWHSINRSLLEH